MSVRSFFIVWYCEEVAEARRALASVSWESVVPLLVATSAIRSRWPSRACSARSLAWGEDGPDAAWNASALAEVWTPDRAVAYMILWSAVAAEALPKTSPRSLVDRCSHSSVSWWARKAVFHAVHVLLAHERLSQSRRCLGKLPAARREPVAMAASHFSSIGSDALTDFLCASSYMFTYSGTRGSSARQPRVSKKRETISVALRPPLPPLRRAKKSRRGTLLRL